MSTQSPRIDADPLSSDKKNIAGLLETALRRFKNLCTALMLLPLYAVGCAVGGIALVPGLLLYRELDRVSAGSSELLHLFALGFAVLAAYFLYGFTLLFLLPLINFVTCAKLKPWRGPYYSLQSIRWYFHNAATYLMRLSFLEFITPSPFNHLFYRMMGMKIGRGTIINTTFISDPSMIELGKNVTIGGSVTMLAHYGQGGYLVLAPIKIGNGVTIGIKATIMGGVTIGNGAKILPNSVVLPNTTIPAGETWGGVPVERYVREAAPASVPQGSLVS